MHTVMNIGVIISTYNNPQWLEKTLWGYVCQERKADEIIIADDGSGPETARLIEQYARQLPIKHVWHEDKGFRKTVILNKALRVAESDYLVFTDQIVCPALISSRSTSTMPKRDISFPEDILNYP